MPKYAKVRLPGNAGKSYTYKVPEGAVKLYALGQRVRVPVGNHSIVGEITEFSDELPDFETREILGTAD